MSLDVYLTITRDEIPECRKAADLLRSNGFETLASDIESRHDCSTSRTVYERNITHNLGKMADEAGIYRHLWRPDEIGVSKANQLILPLREGLAILLADPDRFRKFNPSNGWGDYAGLVDFVREYLAACEEHPGAGVDVSR